MKVEFGEQIQDDFDRARSKELITKILSFLKNENDELLSFHDIKSILKPGASVYKGVIPVKISHIVGSEGRHKDFNKLFLPRYQHLRFRWQRVNLAHYKNIILPPIKLYEIGGVYFVRDGNHRVSVAMTQGVEFIDAEVVCLNSVVTLRPDMTKEDLKDAIIDFEKKSFLKVTNLDALRKESDLSKSTTDRIKEHFSPVSIGKFKLKNVSEEVEIFEL